MYMFIFVHVYFSFPFYVSTFRKIVRQIKWHIICYTAAAIIIVIISFRNSPSGFVGAHPGSVRRGDDNYFLTP